MFQWKKKTTLITFLLLLGVVAFLNYKVFAPFLLPMAVGGILAILMYPLHKRLTRRLSRRWASAVASLLLVICIIAPVASFTATAVDQAIGFAQSLSRDEGFANFSIDRTLNKAMKYKPMQKFFGDQKQVEQQLRQGLQKGGALATGWILSMVAAFPTIAVDLVIAVITCFFMLSDGPTFFRWLRDKIPMEEEVRDRFYSSLKTTSVSVIWAGIVAAAVQASLMFLGYLILGVPAAFLAGGATFFLAWIPVVGSAPLWILATIYLFAKHMVWQAVVMIVLGLLIGVIDNVIRSLVVGGRGEMHPLVSLVAIMGGVQVFGLVGVFFGPILAAILIALLQIWPAVGSRFGLAERNDLISGPPLRAAT